MRPPSDHDDGFHDEDDFEDLVPCPNCRQPVYEEAEVCPYCDAAIPHEDSFRYRPWWLVIVGLLGLAAAVGWLAFC